MKTGVFAALGDASFRTHRTRKRHLKERTWQADFLSRFSSPSWFHVDHITIAGQTVEFGRVFYTWMAMLVLFVVGWLVRRDVSLIPGKMQNIFE